MDIAYRGNKDQFWAQPLPTLNRTQINVHPTSISSFHSNIPFYPDPNSLKRTFSQTNDHEPSTSVKRPYHPPPNTVTVQQTDDEDDDDDDSNQGQMISKTNGTPKRNDYQRRAAHTAAEQKRRNAIRKGYDALQALVPNSHLLDPVSSQKVSKAAILKRSIDYLQQLNDEKQRLETQLDTKRKEIFCLDAVRKTYQDMIETNMKLNQRLNTSIDDRQKFQTFQKIADELFLSFDQAMQTNRTMDFAQFASTMLRWVEDSCRPSETNEVIRRVMANHKTK